MAATHAVALVSIVCLAATTLWQNMVIPNTTSTTSSSSPITTTTPSTHIIINNMISISRSTSSQGYPHSDGIAVSEGLHLSEIAGNSRAMRPSWKNAVTQYVHNDAVKSEVCNAATKDGAVTKEQLDQLLQFGLI
eukprot:1387218-Amphidinium_carterae.4